MTSEFVYGDVAKELKSSAMKPAFLSRLFKLEEDSLILVDENGECYMPKGDAFDPPLPEGKRFEVDGTVKSIAANTQSMVVPQSENNKAAILEMEKDDIITTVTNCDEDMNETKNMLLHDFEVVTEKPESQRVNQPSPEIEDVFDIRKSQTEFESLSINTKSPSSFDESFRNEHLETYFSKKNQQMTQSPNISTRLQKILNAPTEKTTSWRPFTSKAKNASVCNILLFGETGSGKSTLINYLTNFFLGGSLENLKIAIPTMYHKATEHWKSSEKDLHDATKSKTSECTVYSFTKDRLRYNFIDTPGLSDTEGTEKDDQHIDKIMSTAGNSETLTAIIIVINGTVARATVNLRNTLVRLRDSVPDILLNNLLVVLTNCSETSANFKLESLKPWTIPKNNVFYMNNSALSNPGESWIGSKKIKALKYEWQTSMEEIEEMIEKIKQLGHIATNAFRDMRQKREKIKAELHAILLEVKKLQNLQSELSSAQVAQKDATTNIQKYSNYKQNKQVEYVEMEETNYHNTICMTHTEKVCHEHCGLTYTSTVGAEIFTGCSCMSGPKCHVCECGHSTHYHAKKKPVKKTKTVEEILKDVKSLYDQHTNTKVDLQKKIGVLNTDITALQQALKKKETEIHECCRALKKICSQFNFVAELKSVIDTMEANARTITSVSARAEADSMIENIKYLAGQLSQS